MQPTRQHILLGGSMDVRISSLVQCYISPPFISSLPHLPYFCAFFKKVLFYFCKAVVLRGQLVVIETQQN